MSRKSLHVVGIVVLALAFGLWRRAHDGRVNAVVASATHRFPALTSGAREGLLVPHADTLRVLVALLDGRDHRGVDWDAFATWPNGAIVTHNWPRPA